METVLDELRKPEYASMSDQEAADAMWDKWVWIREWVDTADAITHASGEGYYANLEDARNRPADIPGTPQDRCRQAAINILKFIESPKTHKIDMDSQKAIGMKMALSECGFATAEQVASLDALANKRVRWVDYYGHGNQSADSIRVARDELSGLKQRRETLLANGGARWNAFYAAVDSLKVGDPDPNL